MSERERFTTDSTMSGEPIARVVADLRAGRIRTIYEAERAADVAEVTALNALAQKVARSSGPVVDATPIYESLVARDDPVALYEDHPCIAPPWPFATICYRNEHGNVIAMTMVAEENNKASHRDPRKVWERGNTQPGGWEPAEPVDWDRVRWCIDTYVWVGGRSPALGPFPTSGPAHMWRFAIYADGEPADLHWVQLVPHYPRERWDMAHLVLLGALNFCNCRNIELVEPKRPRPEAKRIARTGVRVSTINVFPTGKSVRGSDGERKGGTPLTSVRGHFACYGPEYDRGLLFGKLSGRFWIPQHARGEATVGEVRSDYVLHAQ